MIIPGTYVNVISDLTMKSWAETEEDKMQYVRLTMGIFTIQTVSENVSHYAYKRSYFSSARATLYAVARFRL